MTMDADSHLLLHLDENERQRYRAAERVVNDARGSRDPDMFGYSQLRLTELRLLRARARMRHRRRGCTE